MSDRNARAGDVWVVYDGACPFCSSYVLLYRLRETTKAVHLIDARSVHPILDEIRRENIDLDRGMAVKFDGRFYHGADAMSILALLGSSDTVFNRFNRVLFRRAWLSRLLYPMLARGRSLTLRLLGRPLIGDV